MEGLVQINEKQLFLLILKFLKERELFKTYIALETETNTSLEELGEEFSMLRQLILEGQFEEGEVYLQPFLEKFGNRIHPAVFEIKKQYYLELLDIGPDYQIMTRLLKSIQNYSTKEEYKKLFYLLSLENITEDAEYKEWTPEKGRLECFEKVKGIIAEVFPLQQEEKKIDTSLPKMIERLLNLEVKNDKNKKERVQSIISLQQNQHPNNYLLQSQEIESEEDELASILDDSLISTSSNKIRLEFKGKHSKNMMNEGKTFKKGNDDFDEIKSANFKPNVNKPSSNQVTAASAMLPTKTGPLNPKHQQVSHQSNNYTQGGSQSYAQSQSQQSNFQENASNMPSNLMEFMELDESVIEESQQTEFLELYQQRINQQQLNKSHLLRGQKLLASNNNPSFVPQVTQSEVPLNYQQPAYNSNFFSQSTPPVNIQSQKFGLSSQQQDLKNSSQQSKVPRNQSEEYGHSRRFYAPQNQSHKKDEKEKESNIYHPKENDDVNGSADTEKALEEEVEEEEIEDEEEGNNWQSQLPKESQKASQIQNQSKQQPQQSTSQINQSQKPSKTLNSSQKSSNQKESLIRKSQEDFEQFSYHKDFFNQTAAELKQNQSGTSNNSFNKSLPLKSKSAAYNQKPLSNSQEIFQYNYQDLVEVCQIKDVQPIRTAQFSPDGEYFALGTNSKALKTFSLTEAIKTFRNGKDTFVPVWEKPNHHGGSVYTLDWSRDGHLIATGSIDQTVKVVEVPPKQKSLDYVEPPSIEFIGHTGIVRSVKFHPDSNILYSSGMPDQDIMVWSLQKEDLLLRLQGHTDSVHSIDIDGGGQLLASVSKDRTLRLWDLRTNQQANCIDMSLNQYDQLNYVNLNNGFSNSNLKNLLKNSKKLLKSAASDNTACVAHTNGLVSVWDLRKTSKSLQEIKMHSADCRSAEFDPTGNYIVSTSFDKSICIYDISQQTVLTKLNNHSDRVVLGKFHPFLPFILSTSADFTSRLFAPRDFIKTFSC